MYILDTNVISEASKPRPHPNVLRWLSLDVENAVISAMTIGEIVKGIEALSEGKRRENLNKWLRLVTASSFQNRIIPIDEVVAAEWGRLSIALRRTLPCADSLLAATARVHNLVVATRNERDFVPFDVPIFNPWRA